MANNEKNIYEDIFGFEQGSENEKEEVAQVSEIKAEEEYKLPQGVAWEELEDEEDEIEIDDSPIDGVEEKELSELDERFNQINDYMPDNEDIRENKLTKKGEEARKNKKQGTAKTVPFTQPESQKTPPSESIELLLDIPEVELIDDEFDYEVRDNEIVSFSEFDISEDSFEEISTLTNSSETSFENEEIVETSIEEIEIEIDSDTIIPEFEISTEKTQKNDSLFFNSESNESDETFVTIDEPENKKTSYFPEEAETSSSNSVVIESDNPNDFVEKRESDNFIAYTDSYDDLNREYHKSTIDTIEKNTDSFINDTTINESKPDYSNSAFTEQLSSYGFTNIEISETGSSISVSAAFNDEVFDCYIDKSNSQAESSSANFELIAGQIYNSFSPASVYEAEKIEQYGNYAEIRETKKEFWSTEEFVSKITSDNSFSDISIQKNQNDTTTYSGKYNGQNFTIKLDDISHKPLDSNISEEAMSFFSSSLSDYNSLVAEREHKAKTTEMYADKKVSVDDDYNSNIHSSRVSYNEVYKDDNTVDVKQLTNGNGLSEGNIFNPTSNNDSFGCITTANTTHKHNPNNPQDTVNATIVSKAKASQFSDIEVTETSKNPFLPSADANTIYNQAVATSDRHFNQDTHNETGSQHNYHSNSSSIYPNGSANTSLNNIDTQYGTMGTAFSNVSSNGIFKKIEDEYKMMSARRGFDKNKLKQLGQMAMTPLESKVRDVANGNEVADGVHAFGDFTAIPKFLIIDKGRQSSFNDSLKKFSSSYINQSTDARYINKIFRGLSGDTDLNILGEVNLSNMKDVDKLLSRYQNDFLKDFNADITRMSSKSISALINEKKKLLKKDGLSNSDIEKLNKEIKTLSGYLYLRNFKLNHNEMVSNASWEMLERAGLKIPKNYKDLHINTIDGFNEYIKTINRQLEAYGITDIRKLTRGELDRIIGREGITLKTKKGKEVKIIKDKKGKFEEIPEEIKNLLKKFASKEGKDLLNSFNDLNHKSNSISSFLSLVRREIGDNDVLDGSMIYLKMVRTVRKTVHYTVSIAQHLAHFTHLDRALTKYGRKALAKISESAPKVGKAATGASKAFNTAREFKQKYNPRALKSRARKRISEKLASSSSKVANALGKVLGKAAKVAKTLRKVTNILGKYFLVVVATVAVCILVIGMLSQFFSFLVSVISFPSVAWAKITGNDAANKPIVDIYTDLTAQEAEWQNAIQKYSDYSIKQMFNEDTGFDFVVNTDGYYNFGTGKISQIKNFGGAEYASENASVAHKNGIEYHYYDSYYWQMNDDGTVKLENGKPVINDNAKETGFRSNIKEIMAVGDIFVQMDYTQNKEVKDIYHSYVGYKGHSIESTLIKESNTKKNKDLNYKDENTGVDLFTATHYFAPDLGELYSCDGCKKTTIKCNAENLKNVLGSSKAIYSCRDGNFYNGSIITSWDGAYHSEGCVKHNSTKVKGNYNKVELLASELKDSFGVVYCDGYHKKGSEYVTCKEAGGHNTISYYLTNSNLKIAKLYDGEFENENNNVNGYCDNYTFEQVKDKNGKVVTQNISIDYYMPETVSTKGTDGSFTRNSLDSNLVNFINKDKDRSEIYSYVKINSWYIIVKAGAYTTSSSLLKTIQENVDFGFKTGYQIVNDDVLVLYTLGDSNRKCESQYSHRQNTTMKTVSAGGYNVSVRDCCNTCYSPSTTETTYKKVTKTIALPKYKAVCKGHCGGHNIDYCIGHKDLIVRATIFSTVEEELVCGQNACSNPLHQVYFEQENMSIVAQKFSSMMYVHNSQCHIHGPECLPKTSVYYADVMSGPSSLEYIPAKYLTHKRTNWGIKSIFLEGIDDYDQSLEEMDVNKDFPNIYNTDKYLAKYAWSHGLNAESNKSLVTLKLMNSWTNVGINATDSANASVQTIHTDEQRELLNKVAGQISSGDYYDLSNLGSAEKDKDMYGDEAIENVEDGVMLNNDATDRNAKILAERLNNRLYFVQYALSTVGKVPYYDSGIASNSGFEGNAFGTVNTINGKTIPDTLGRTLNGLNDTSWIVWAYKSAFDTELDEKYVTKTLTTLPSANTEHLNFGTFLPTANWTQFSTSKSTVADINKEYRKLLPGDILVNKTTGRKAIFLMWADNNTLGSKLEEAFSTDNLLRMYVVEEGYYCEGNKSENAPKVNNVQIRICNREEWSAYSSDILNFGTVKSTYSYGSSGLGFPTDVFGISGMTSPYGYRILNGVEVFHHGVDLAGPEGTPLFAIAEGKVVLAEWCGGYGNCVMIDHDINGITYRTIYGHCSKILVKNGATVTAGQMVGLMGNTGHSFGSHLHFEVRSGGCTIHPGTLVPILAIVEERKSGTLKDSNGNYIDGTTVAEPFNKILRQVKADPSLYNQYFGQSIVSSNKSESTVNGISLNFSALKKNNGDQIKTCALYRSVYDIAYQSWSEFKKIDTIEVSSSSISYLDKDVKIGYKYCYYIQGNDGLSKVKSPEVVVSHTLAPEVKISNTSSGINVAWNKITGATGYVVYRYTLNGDSWSTATKIATVKEDVTSYIDTSTSSGVKHKYTVKAYYKDTGNGTVSYSSYASSNVLMYLTQPTVSVKKNSGSITVSWTQSAGATNYVVYRKTYNSSTKKWSGWSKVNTLTSNKNSYKDTSVKSGTKYQYTVKATNGSYSSSYKESGNITY